MGEDFYCGAGKSTLMKFLLGLLPCQTGEIYVSGTQVSKENLARVRRTMGYVLQNSDNQMCTPTVYEDMMFAPPPLTPITEGRSSIRSALSRRRC